MFTYTTIWGFTLPISYVMQSNLHKQKLDGEFNLHIKSARDANIFDEELLIFRDVWWSNAVINMKFSRPFIRTTAAPSVRSLDSLLLWRNWNFQEIIDLALIWKLFSECNSFTFSSSTAWMVIQSHFLVEYKKTKIIENRVSRGW